MARKLSAMVAAVALPTLVFAGTAPARVDLDRNRAVSAPTGTAKPAGTRDSGPLIAPAAACPGQDNLRTAAAEQEQAMACMVDYARRQAGLAPLVQQGTLNQSAREKSLDVLRCDSFSHFACGRDFTYWMQQSGYTAASCWRVGENLAWGIGEHGTVRSIFAAWMRSPGHRVNILGDFEEAGLDLRLGTLEGHDGARVWTQHFGSRCE